MKFPLPVQGRADDGEDDDSDSSSIEVSTAPP